MNREEYKQVKKIFQSALDVAPESRADYLNEKCSGNAALRREVEKLLDSYKSDYLEQPVVEKIAQAFDGGNLSAGQEIGHYKIVKKIGAGGMGEVFLAEDTRLKRKIALKILPAVFGKDKARLHRFEQEAQAASALNHPNILTVHEFGAEGETIFIASEFVKGETLRARLGGEAPGLSEILDIAVQIAAALCAAHESRIVHRDIKPENIMLREDGLVKVLDFGLAKLIENKNADDAAETQINTTTGLVMGTPAYMSPEQARGLAVDARTDLWSLGVVLYEILAGYAPFTGETPSDQIASVLTSEAAPLDEKLPLKLNRIVKKALRKNPDERYQTALDLLLDLKEIKTDLEFQDKSERSFDSFKSETKTQRYHQTGTIAGTTDETPPQNDFQPIRARRPIFFQLAFAALLITFVGVSIWWLAFGRGRQTAATDAESAGSFKTYQITNWASIAGVSFTSAAFSPDGKFIAFESTKSGANSIWVKQTGAGDAIQVTKDEFYNYSPVFSPDGEEIIYYSSHGNLRGLWRVSLMGGQPKLVAGFDRPAKPRLWSKSGKIYFQDFFNLFAADAETGKISGITGFPSSSPRTIRISPDESQIAIGIYEDAIWKILVKPVNIPETKLILVSKSRIENVVWHPDGKRLFFSMVTDAFFQIYSVGLDGGEPVQISYGDIDAYVQDISPNGERILFSSSTETSDLWKIDKEVAKESLMTSQIDGELWADVSPSGESIAYQSVRNLRLGDNLYAGSIVKLPVTKDSEPLRLAESGFLPQWSPDGETVAFLKFVGGPFEIWTVTKTGDQLKRVSSEGIQGLEASTLSPYLISQVKHLSWSPKGSGLAFSAHREGVSNIWLAPADGSNERKLSDNQDPNQILYCPLWTPDETGIAFYSRTNRPDSEGKIKFFVWFYDLTTGVQRKILEMEESVRFLGWAKNQEELIFAARDKNKKADLAPPETPIRAVSLKTGQIRELRILKEAYFYNIFLSPDKGTIGFTSRAGGNDNVWISPLEGGEPRKLTGNNDPRLYFSSLAWSPDGKTIYFGKQNRFILLSMLINQKISEKKNEKSN